MKKNKTLGIILLILALLLFIWIIIFTTFGALFAYGSRVSFLIMFPFIGLSIFQIVMLILLINLSIKLIREKLLPIKQNVKIR